MAQATIDRQSKLEQANQALQERAATIGKDHRLGYHIMAPANWINDPNGLVFFKGEYHVFYQHHPYDEHWGPMHWGHAKSADLVHWEHLPIALAPDHEYDKDGCFSGSAVVKDDTLYLIYTGHVWVDRPKDIAIQTQCIAYSKDGVTFTKYEHNPVIENVPSDSTGHFRDPKVWEKNGTFHMVLGNRTKEDVGRVIHYSSSNLIDWKYEGVLAKADEKLGYMWECPDFFTVDGKEVLFFSPQGMKADGDRYQNLYQTGYLVGTYDESSKEFVHGSFEELDKGHDYYAVQTLEDHKGRRIAIGWMDMWESEMPTKEDGWCGAMTLPREVSVNQDQKVIMKPVEELKMLRKDQLSVSADVIDHEVKLSGCQGELLELELVFTLKDITAKEFGVMVRKSTDGTEQTIISVDVEQSKLFIDRDQSGKGVKGIRKTHIDLEQDVCKLHIYLDRSSVEIFANDGEINMTSRIYPKTSSIDVAFYAKNGKVKLETANVWTLKDIWEG
ncbi:glycoside hydrolase family 32 protein [Bacillus testis]|uniref:glycoside hydrolase family 32 protein n=1 Tax=Bacillus testis TaxID=1622072 RepID=UPI00067E76F3|nr:glycoside hydrolase family 32 protein [Bacillus testis]